MSESIIIDGSSYISSKKAASIYGCTNDYIARICRKGMLSAKLVGHTWYVDESALKILLQNQKNARDKAAQELAEKRRLEYESYQTQKQVAASQFLGAMEEERVSFLPPKEVVASSPLLLPAAPSFIFLKRGVAMLLMVTLGFGVHGFIDSEYPATLAHEAAQQKEIAVAGFERTVARLGETATLSAVATTRVLASISDEMLSAAASVAVGVTAISNAAVQDVRGSAVAAAASGASFSREVATVFELFVSGVMRGAVASGNVLTSLPQQSAAAVAQMQSSFFLGTSDSLTQTFTRAFENPAQGIAERFARFFINPSSEGQVAIEEVPILAEEEKLAVPNVPTSSSGVAVGEGVGGSVIPSTPVVQTVVQPVVERTTVVSGLSEEEFTSRIESVKNGLLSEILKYSAAADRATGANFSSIALSQRIDELASANISSSDFSSGTIQSSTITNSSFSGGSVSATDLTASGALTISGTFTNSSTATSTFSGKLLLTHAPTLAHTFGAWMSGAADTNYQDAALIINPSSATADSNLFAIAVNGSPRFLIDAEGDAFVNSITATGGITLATTTASTFSVENNTTLGDSLTDTTTINGTLIVTGTTTASTVAGNFGVGTTSPWARLSVDASAGQSSFAIGSSTRTTFEIDSLGRASLGTSSASAYFDTGVGGLSVQGTGDSNKFGLAPLMVTRQSATAANNSYLMSTAGGSLSNPLRGTVAVFRSVDTSSPIEAGSKILIDASGTIANAASGASLTLRSSGGTFASTTALVSGAPLGAINFMGTQASGDLGLSATNARIQALAAENWGTSAQGTHLIFAVTATSSTALATRAILSSAGNLGVGAGITTSVLPDAAIHISSGSATGNNLRLGRTSSNEYGEIDFNNSGNTTLTIRNAYGSGSDNALINFDTAQGTALTIKENRNVGVGTTSPYVKFAIVNASASVHGLELSGVSGTGSGMFRSSNFDNTTFYREFGRNNTTGAFEIRRAQGGAATTDFVIDTSGNAGIGTTSPFRKLSVSDTVASAQAAIAYDDSRYTQLQTDSVGDFIIDPSGNDAFLNDDNLWVCAGGACAAGAPSGTGNLIVESRFGLGTSTPFAKLSVGADGSIVTSEKALTDSATITINWTEGNQQRVVLGGNRTINFSNYIPGSSMRLVLCQDDTGGRTVTWGDSALLWNDGEAPTLTTTGNKCDVLAFIATAGTSTTKVFGTSALNF